MYYLLNFNLAPRQIWITRHGESVDNVNGRIGGDSDLSEKGTAYARALTKFIQNQRQAWDVHQRDKALSTHFPPLPGDTTPPNPEYNHGGLDDSESPKRYVYFRQFLPVVYHLPSWKTCFASGKAINSPRSSLIARDFASYKEC